MGTIRKESTFATIASYLGAALGFFNKIILLPRFFDLEQVGLINLTVNTAMTFAQLAILGYGNVMVKFFPYYKNKENGHNGILTLGLMFGITGFVFLTTIFFLFKTPILSHLSKNSGLLVDYYFLIFITGFFFLIFNIFMVYLRSMFKTWVASIIRDVVLRIAVTGTITLYILDVVSFDQFIWMFTIVNCSIAVGIIVYVIWLRQFFLLKRFSKFLRSNLKEVVGFGAIAFLSNASVYIMTTLDSLMVADMVSLETAGIYTTLLFVAAFMLFPFKALVGISAPKVAEYWKSNELDKIQKLYQRVSFLNLIIGMLLFVGIWINRHNIVKLTKPEFAAGYYTLLFLCIARLVDMITGLNGFILVTSKKFKYDLLFNIFLLTISILSNLYFIKHYGMTGAAFATLISVSLFNLVRVAFIWHSFKMQPFQWKMLLVVGFAGLGFGVDFLIPEIDPFLLDIVLRSLSFGLIFGTLVYFSGISPDLNKFPNVIWAKIKKKTGK